MKPRLRNHVSAGGNLRKEMLKFEPVRMVNMKHSSGIEYEQQLQQPEALAGVQILELSNVDQLFDFHLTVTLFYDVGSSYVREDDTNDDGPVTRLQGALEQLLVHYPAAAGRLRQSETEGRLEIAYNSAPSCHWTSGMILYGVPFVVAHANIPMCELGDVSLPQPSLDLLCPSLPKQSLDSSRKYLVPRPVMAIQVTTFTCGGFALAHMCSHAFLDGYGAATFLQNLGSIARGAGLVTHVPSDISSRYRREVMKPRMPPTPTVSHTYIRTRQQGEGCGQVLQLNGHATRFVFSGAALEALRLRASNFDPSQAKLMCSRYQALVALLWVARAKSLVAGNASSRPLMLDQELPFRFPMNLREKGIPRLTREYFGNAVLQITVSATLQELCESSLTYVVGKVRSALMGAGMQDMLPEWAQSQTDYVELQLRAGLVPYLNHSSLLGMPSLVGLPFYDTDCGWGRPVYCGCPSRQLDDQHIIILDHPAARAWNVLAVFKSEEEHASFQEEIVEYIS